MRALLIGLLALGCASTTGAGRGQAVGTPLPQLVLHRFDNGTQLDLAKLRGKVVLIDLWASWCEPCKEEMPLLDEMAGRLRSRGVEIIAVSVDEDRAAAEAFVRGRPQWALTLVHDPHGKIPELLQPAKMPTSYVVDSTGVVRHINEGFTRADAPLLEQRLVDLLPR
jgi:cytochrome c biogenesis protein CcmG, thiol:disulfide interchange protein DsbE